MEDQTQAKVWVDDHNEIFRRGLISCLAGERFCIVGESALLNPQPDLDDIDVLLFDLDGASLARVLRLAHPTEAKLVGIAASPNDESLFEAVDAGLAGLLLRSEVTPSRLVDCLCAVISGNTAMPRHLLSRLLQAMGTPKRGVAGQLTRRELDVLRLMGEGSSTREIADALCYSEKTVKNVVHDVLMKMCCRTRAQAVARAARQGFI